MQTHAARFISEKDFQQAVRDYARLKGWTCFTTWDSRHSPNGEPDLRLVRPPRVIFAELKAHKGRLTDAQANSLELLRRCPGIETYLWWPEDWDSILQRLE